MTRSLQFWRRGGRMGLMTVLLAAGVSTAMAGEAPSEKLQKQMAIFENTVNQMLVDSPYLMVSHSSAANGLYLPGYGVVITFRASLANQKFDFEFSDWFNSMKIEHLGDNKIVVQFDDWDEESKEEVERKVREAAEDAREAAEDAREAAQEIKRQHEEMQDEWLEAREEIYEDGKEELVEILMDYGETLLRLNDNENVMLAMFLDDRGFFFAPRAPKAVVWGSRDDDHEHYHADDEVHGDRGPSRLLVSARMADIRAYARGSIDEDQMRDRIQITEY